MQNKPTNPEKQSTSPNLYSQVCSHDPLLPLTLQRVLTVEEAANRASAQLRSKERGFYQMELHDNHTENLFLHYIIVLA